VSRRSPRGRAGRRVTGSRTALLLGALAGAGCVVLAHQASRPLGLRRHGLLAEILLWAAVGAAGALLLRRAPRRAAVAVALGLGLAVRLAALAPTAPLSDDLYRYAWDGRVQAHAVDPYRYTPSDIALIGLRDTDWLWPTARCLKKHCTLINRPTVHTIYPPVAELWFLGLHETRLTQLHDRGLELAGLALDLAVLAVLLALLRATGRDERLIAVWALSPLPVLESVSDAHVDALALLLSLGALVLARRGRPTAASAVLGVAALVKIYPALLLPAVLARSVRGVARQAGAFLAVVALGYLPHVVAVGGAVVGYLPGYLKEEDYSTGTRYLLVEAFGLRGTPATLAVLLGLLVVVGLVAWLRPDPFVGATWLLGALLLLVTPVQPWYAVVLGGVALAAGRWEWLAVGIAGYPLYIDTLSSRADAVHVGTRSYAAAAVLVLVVGAVRRLRQGPDSARGAVAASRRPRSWASPSSARSAGLVHSYVVGSAPATSRSSVRSRSVLSAKTAKTSAWLTPSPMVAPASRSVTRATAV